MFTSGLRGTAKDGDPQVSHRIRGKISGREPRDVHQPLQGKLVHGKGASRPEQQLLHGTPRGL
jgi:hypothetical protein